MRYSFVEYTDHSSLPFNIHLLQTKRCKTGGTPICSWSSNMPWWTESKGRTHIRHVSLPLESKTDMSTKVVDMSFVATNLSNLSFLLLSSTNFRALCFGIFSSIPSFELFVIYAVNMRVFEFMSHSHIIIFIFSFLLVTWSRAWFSFFIFKFCFSASYYISHRISHISITDNFWRR